MDFVFNVFGIVTSYVLGEGFQFNPESRFPNVSVSAQTFGGAVIRNDWDNGGLDMLSQETIRNCIIHHLVIRRQFERYEEKDEHVGDMWLRINAILDTDAGFHQMLDEMLEYESNVGHRGSSIILLFHGIYKKQNWKLLSEDDFWKIAVCYGEQPDQGKSHGVKMILNTQTALATEVLLNGFVRSDFIGINNLRLDVSSDAAIDNNVVLPFIDTEEGDITDFLKQVYGEQIPWP